MKYFFLLCTLFPFYSKAQDNGVHFEQGLTWEQARDKAKSENKYIFLDCYATWCAPCKEMDKSTYPDEKLGEYMNAHFVSIRVQMDTSKMDNKDIEGWYHEAHQIKINYKIRSFPSFLFFSPDGLIVHKELGYKKANELLQVGNEVISQKRQYYTLLQEYRSGHISYSDMPYLAITTQNLEENKLADSMAQSYISNYLDKLNKSDLFNKEILLFLERFRNILSSSDSAFLFIYNNRSKIDREMDPGYSYTILDNVIVNEEVDPHLFNGNKPISGIPDWKLISNNITKKFDPELSERIIIDTKISFYLTTKNWSKLIKSYIEKNEKYGLDTLGSAKYFTNNQINDYIFMHSHNKKELEKGIKWMKIIVDADPKDAEDMDTYANLLYKAGKIKDALIFEEKAAILAPSELEIKANFEKMKIRRPTWPAN